MYIAIDAKRMVFTHKHPSYRVVGHLVFIEAPYGKYHVAPVEGCTALYPHSHLLRLWTNTTGLAEFPGPVTQLAAACRSLAAHLPTTAAIATEADLQSAYVEADAEPYLPHAYTHGRKQPSPQPEGWEPPALTLILTAAELANAIAGLLPPEAPHAQVLAATVAPPQPAQPTKAPAQAGAKVVTDWGALKAKS